MRRSLFMIIAVGVLASPFSNSAAPVKPPAASAPSCENIGRAIAAAHGPIGTVEDRTAKSQEVGGSLPYTVLRMCLVTIPGQRLPLRVGIDGASHQFFMAMMTRMAARPAAAPSAPAEPTPFASRRHNRCCRM